MAQVQQATDTLVEKGLESAVSYADGLNQWAYITIGASVAFLAKEFSEQRKGKLSKLPLLIFLPGWGYLTRAIYFGVRVRGAYTAYLMNPHRDIVDAVTTINRDAATQLASLKCGLLFFVIWLAFFLIIGVFRSDGPRPNENLNIP